MIVQFLCDPSTFILRNFRKFNEQESDLSVSGEDLASGIKVQEIVTATNKILLEELLKNFDKPLRFYPLIDAEDPLL